MKGDIKINRDKFPTRDEFYKTVMELKREREKKRQAIYLAYLKEQKFKQKL
ncbi:MAG TPA: hypothetical protein VFC70_02730 [Oscillospiraceae bacterium]|nr:hypothetical protein [Oscillospiraceae bacterium]